MTKVGARRDDSGGWLPALAPDELRAGVEANLRSLRVERMDLVNLRLLGDDGGADVPLPEQLGVLEDMRQEGKLDLIGVSNVTLRGRRAGARARRARRGAERLQHRQPRRRADVVELCREREIAFVPFFPLGSAFTGGPEAAGRRPGDRRGRREARRDARRRSRWPGCWPATTASC